MRIIQITPHPDWTLTIISDDGRIGDFDVTPYLQEEAFEDLKNVSEFMKVSNGGYFVEWNCGVDLSVDTIEAHWQVSGTVSKEVDFHPIH